MRLRKHPREAKVRKWIYQGSEIDERKQTAVILVG